MQINLAALIAIRQNVPLTRGELAKRIGFSEEGLRLIEAGARTPRPSTVRALAEALEIDVSAFTIPSEVPMGDGGKGSGRKAGTPRRGKSAADDQLMGRLRGASARAKQDPPPPSVAANARKAFGKKKAS